MAGQHSARRDHPGAALRLAGGVVFAVRALLAVGVLTPLGFGLILLGVLRQARSPRPS